MAETEAAADAQAVADAVADAGGEHLVAGAFGGVVKGMIARVVL